MSAEFARADNLAVVRSMVSGRPRYIVSDVAGRYLALSASAYLLLGRLDGATSPQSAAAGVMAATETAAVLRRLVGAGLVRGAGAPPPAASVPQRRGPLEGRYLFVRRELVARPFGGCG